MMTNSASEVNVLVLLCPESLITIRNPFPLSANQRRVDVPVADLLLLLPADRDSIRTAILETENNRHGSWVELNGFRKVLDTVGEEGRRNEGSLSHHQRYTT